MASLPNKTKTILALNDNGVFAELKPVKSAPSEKTQSLSTSIHGSSATNSKPLEEASKSSLTSITKSYANPSERTVKKAPKSTPNPKKEHGLYANQSERTVKKGPNSTPTLKEIPGLPDGQPKTPYQTKVKDPPNSKASDIQSERTVEEVVRTSVNGKHPNTNDTHIARLVKSLKHHKKVIVITIAVVLFVILFIMWLLKDDDEEDDRNFMDKVASEVQTVEPEFLAVAK